MAIRERYKVYVDVHVLYHDDGQIQPLAITWEDGRSYPIDRVTRVQRQASRKAGGAGLMYTCRCGTREFHLFFDDYFQRWFLEAKEPGVPEIHE